MKVIHEDNINNLLRNDTQEQQLECVSEKSIIFVQRKVQINCHVVVESNYYSVPHDYVGKYVNVKVGTEDINVYDEQGKHICQHFRKYGKNRYSTIKKHLPEKKDKSAWNGDRFKKWALNIGISTVTVVDRLINHYSEEEQAYKSIIAILSLTKRYSNTELEDACDQALKSRDVPRVKYIQAIIEHERKTKNTGTIHEDNLTIKHSTKLQ